MYTVHCARGQYIFEVSFLNSVSRIVVTLTFANYVLEYLKLKQRA